MESKAGLFRGSYVQGVSNVWPNDGLVVDADGLLTFPETNSEWKHLKMDGWNTILSYWGPAYFQGQTVSFSQCTYLGGIKVDANVW